MKKWIKFDKVDFTRKDGVAWQVHFVFLKLRCVWAILVSLTHPIPVVEVILNNHVSTSMWSPAQQDDAKNYLGDMHS